jgi:cell division protease FtsH
MKKTTKNNLAGIGLATVTLITCAVAGTFKRKAIDSWFAFSFDSMHWTFWVLLSFCALAVLFVLWRDGLFRKVWIPGFELFSPIDSKKEGSNKQDFRTFEDIAGCEEAIAKLRRVVRWLKSPDHYEQFGAKLPRGILAVGPPGTGKTLLARALAGEVDANFFSVHGSSFVEMFVGVGARRVRTLFAAAVAARKRTGKPSVIFIDEIDAIGKKRGNGGSGADSERDQTLNQLLVCMQGFDTTSGIVVMAATNMPETLDEALTRPGRFDYHVSVDLPDTAGREKIFSIHTRNMNLAPDIKLRDLAIRTPQFSGADIEHACNEAAIVAAERLDSLLIEKPDHKVQPLVAMRDFDQGIDYVQFGDPMLSRARSMSEEDKRNTAFHEAGHCAVQQALQGRGADPITKVTIEPRTKSLGSMQSHATGDRYVYTEEQLIARITTAMGGRAAQEHFLGRKDTGASNDFEQATNLARLMVTQFGMSRLEKFTLKTEGRRSSGMTIGPRLADDIDKEWRAILAECYRDARDIISQNERRIERVAETLLAEQTILADRFLELWNYVPASIIREEQPVA